jgi:Transposase DDE domain
MELASKLLSFVPDEILEDLAVFTQVNKYAKKLQGELLFKLLVYCMVTEKDNSLRGMESAFESSVFQALSSKYGVKTIGYSSISERLKSVKSNYFEEIFEACVKAYKDSLGKEKASVIRFDSTIVSLSAKLLEVGYNLKGGDAEQYRLLKFTVGFSSIPECVYFYTDQAYTSENMALKESLIRHNESRNGKINVFDRGITSRKTYDDFTADKIQFISRTATEARQTVFKNNSLGKKISTPTLDILSDSWVYLYTSNKKKSKYPVRIINAIKKSDKEPIAFITNIKNLKAKEITEIYKSRWDIEVFFKFVKQHLNFSHLLNRSENGIKTVLYVTLTVAILLLHYKQEKGLKGYKIAKKRFAQDLERDMIYSIVLLFGGNAQQAKEFLYKNSS